MKEAVMTVKQETAPPTLREQLMGWRVQLLVEAGMTYDDAWRLARSKNWRDALELMEKGCPGDLAFEIVR